VIPYAACVPSDPDKRPRTWTFLSNHGHVLLAIAADPEIRLRDIAARVGITERAAQLIVHDLEEEGYVSKERAGRRNRYALLPGRPFRHPAEADRDVDDLVAIFRNGGH
jgi:predicted ArsR family transcriptional regulator